MPFIVVIKASVYMCFSGTARNFTQYSISGLLIDSCYSETQMSLDKVNALNNLLVFEAMKARWITCGFMHYVKEKERNSIDSYIRMYEARSAEYIGIYESIVIEFFLRLKIHRICADVPRFYIENLIFIVSMATP